MSCDAFQALASADIYSLVLPTPHLSLGPGPAIHVVSFLGYRLSCCLTLACASAPYVGALLLPHPSPNLISSYKHFLCKAFHNPGVSELVAPLTLCSFL